MYLKNFIAHKTNQTIGNKIQRLQMVRYAFCGALQTQSHELSFYGRKNTTGT